MSKDYNLLRLLLVLFETRQTVAAAKKLKISQPTVSLMLKKLREQFSDELFVRNKTMLEPTPKCLAIAEKLPAILNKLDQLYFDADNWEIEQMEGEAMVFFPPTLMAPIAAPLLAKLSHRSPKLTVTCHPWDTNSLLSLELNKQSLGIGYLPMKTNKNLSQKTLPSDKFMLVTREGHPMRELSLQEILKYPLCVSVIPGYVEASKVEMLIKKYKLEKNVNVRSSDMSMMLELIRLSDTIGVMSVKNKANLAEQFTMYPLPAEFEQDTFHRECALFCHQRDRNAPFTQWVYQEVTQLMLRGVEGESHH
ncbi:LysR family transcriptional regulator [Enterovibrio sp. ZSDZ35]|uniref:LysR family transcriptional regulator n=1 Tax=Enterovibrio qingdaonensis TaxID=2899818 RepID=A0ABT5QJF3_9GAMM|nr:LysR family transcriptional regulator [Enterovibrio sp. ZSDZ35]MDD1780798.1 LysR family transcriptional regulator [Enterovibrio sp. ZSDZ35]